MCSNVSDVQRGQPANVSAAAAPSSGTISARSPRFSRRRQNHVQPEMAATGRIAGTIKITVTKAYCHAAASGVAPAQTLP